MSRLGSEREPLDEAVDPSLVRVDVDALLL